MDASRSAGRHAARQNSLSPNKAGLPHTRYTLDAARPSKWQAASLGSIQTSHGEISRFTQVCCGVQESRSKHEGFASENLISCHFSRSLGPSVLGFLIPLNRLLSSIYFAVLRYTECVS